MRKITKETITAIQFVQGCKGDTFEAITRLESLLDAFLINGQRKKADYVERLIVIIKNEL